MYLLLRNNKQTGPFTLEEMKGMGLKAYDLVWLEGKSAAWRYPCEMEELKAFAPPVDEQPFDRFYKRASATTTASVTHTTVPTPTAAPVAAQARVAMPTSVVPPAPVAMPAPVVPQAPAQPAPVFAGEPSAVPGKRIIYVTMPASRNPASGRSTSVQSPLPGTPDPAHLPYASGSSTHHPVLKSPDAGAVSASSYASPRDEDYSAQMPSLEEQLEAVSPRSAKNRERVNLDSRIARPLIVGAAVLALLVAGIGIGLSLNKQSLGIQSKPGSGIALKDAGQPANHPATQRAAVVPNTTQAITGTAKPKDSVPNITRDPSSTVVPPVSGPAHITKQKQAAAKKIATPQPAIKDTVSANLPSVQREAAHRADIVETKPDKTGEKESARMSIGSQVTVGANHYSVGTFGGINDLQLTVTNRSVYPLDLVVVEVQYVQANKKVYKTENLYFRNIGAGSALMQEAPRSSRGIKVQYKITTISSKDSGVSYSGL